jgi:flagellar biosynthesis protein FlhF
VRFDAAKLGLVTLDAYRVGAHEQLRTYGRILGTPVHLAQDAVTLAEVLAAMSHKRLVLIDTCGVSQRDERLAEMLDMLAQAGTPRQPVQRVLLLNAASHAETLEAVARAWHARESGAAILTKLDEAARIGGALDTVLRNKLVLMGATHGQRVPEDWMAAAGPQLAATALQPGNAPFALCEDEAALLASTQRSAITPIAA